MAVSDDDGYMKSSTNGELRWSVLRMSSVSACSSNQRAQTENIGRELRWANRTVGFWWQRPGVQHLYCHCWFAPLLPRWDGRPLSCSSRSIVNVLELSDTTRLSGELPSEPGLADCQCRGLLLLMQMVVWEGGDVFISSSSFSGRATGDSALNPSVMLFYLFTFSKTCVWIITRRAADWTHLVFWMLRCKPLNLRRKHLSAPVCPFDCISVCFFNCLINQDSIKAGSCIISLWINHNKSYLIIYLPLMINDNMYWIEVAQPENR